jgi:hypothetical protein
MEDKRGTKRLSSTAIEGSSLPSDAKTPPPTPSGSPPPPGSSSKVSSCRPCSPVFEQGGPSGNIIVIELSSSSDEEDFFADIMRDAEFARRLFGNLNRDLLGPPDDGKVIVLSDFKEEEEVHEETAADAEATPSTAVKSLTPTAFAADTDEDPRKIQDDNSDDLSPGPDTGKSSGGGDEVSSPKAVMARTAPAAGLLQRELHSALLPCFLFCAEELGW